MVNARWDYVLASIETDWRVMLGGTYDSLNALSPGKGIGDMAITFLMEMYHPEEILKDDEKRNVMIGKMPVEYVNELAQKIGISSTSTPELYKELKKLKYNGKTKRVFLDFFDIVPLEKIEPDYKKDIECFEEMNYALHDYQRKIVENVNLKFETGSRRCLIHMPTGSGKTRTAMYIISEMMNDEEPFMVLWLAYNKELCDQASKDFFKSWTSRGNRSVELHNFYDKTESSFPRGKTDGIVVSTMAKMLSVMKKDDLILPFISENVSLIVFDEAHQIIAPEYKSIVDQIMNNSLHTKLIGLTATPGRTWNEPEEDEKLSKYFYKNIVEINTDDESPTTMLTRRGFLSEIEWRLLEYETNVLNEEDLDLIKRFRNEDDLPDTVLKKISLDAKRNIGIITEIIRLLKEGKKRMLVFATSVEHARLLSALIKLLKKDYGCESYCIDGKTDKALRDKIIEGFRNNDAVPKIICNYNVLTTGFDAPNVDAGIIARPTKSLVLFSQMVGRMIRGPMAHGGTETATIVSVIDINLPGFKDAHDNWKDVWK